MTVRPVDGDYSRVVDKKCKRVKKKQDHEPHDWIAGVYLTLGNCDGYPARCPGYKPPVPPLSDAERIARLVDLCQTVIAVHERVVMDTPLDQALHDAGIKAFRVYLDLLRPTP